MTEKEIFLKRLQNRLKEAVELQGLPLEQQFAVIESSIDSLLQTNQISVKAVEQHDEEIQKLTDDLLKIQKSISDRYKKTYDGIMGL